MSLVQVNSIREVLEGAMSRISALDRVGLSPPILAALVRAQGFVDKAIGAISRVEQFEAKDKADSLGDSG